MRVVVLGVSGLLGRSISEELLSRGHEVVGVSRSGAAGARMAAEGSLVRTDIVAAPDTELDALLDGAGAAVYCLGPDDRTALPVPVSAALDRIFVTTTVRCAQAAQRQGVGHFLVLGSYLTTFDRLHPEWGLGRRHPYIRARVDQIGRTLQVCPTGALSVLEIPYVFGAITGLVPTLKEALFDRLYRAPIGAAFPGGTAAVTRGDVAALAAGLIEGAVPPGIHPLAVDNVSYRRLSEIAVAEMCRRIPVVTVPVPVLTTGILAGALAYRLRHRAMALNPWHVAHDILGRHLYLDPATHGTPLGLVPRSVEEAIRQTIRAAYPSRPPDRSGDPA